MVIAWPINLNVSCKLHLYSLQRTRSPPGPHLPKTIRNIHLRNYYDLKGKDIDLHFLFLSFTCRWDWTWDHLMISLRSNFQTNTLTTVLCVLLEINFLFVLYSQNLKLKFLKNLVTSGKTVNFTKIYSTKTRLFLPLTSNQFNWQSYFVWLMKKDTHVISSFCFFNLFF